MADQIHLVSFLIHSPINHTICTWADAADNRLQAQQIDVTANNGAVTLWGTAATESERNRAGAAAAKVDGVKTVENKLAIVKGS